MRKARKVRQSKQLTLAQSFAADFEKILEEQMQDPSRKQFYVALLLALPDISTYDLDAMQSIMIRHLGTEFLKKATDKAI